MATLVEGGGSGESLPSLLATVGSVRADADFPLGWTRRLGVPAGVLSRHAHTPMPQPGLAGTHTCTRRQPAQRVSLFMFVLCGGKFLTVL